MEKLLNEHRAWFQRHLADRVTPARQMVKLMEEVGELAHEVFRSPGTPTAGMVDAVGDIIIAAFSCAAALRLDPAACVEVAWCDVRQRDTERIVEGK